MDNGLLGQHCATYMVSLLKAWWGEAATADNDFCYDYLPRLTGSHSTYETVLAQLDGDCKGYFLFGAEPGGRLGQRAGCSGWAWPTWTGWWSGTGR